MQKIYLSLVLASMATLGSSAQVVSHLTPDAEPVQANNSILAESTSAAFGLTPRCPKFTVVKGSDRLQAPIADPLLMTNYQMSRNDSLYFISWGTNVAQARYTSRVGEIIVGTDGSFYLQNPIFAQQIGTWIKGELNEGIVSFSFPQPIAYAQFEDGSTTRLMATVVEQQDNTLVPVEGEPVVTFTWDDDTLKSTDPTVMIGMVLENTGDWTGYADWDISMNVMRDVPSSYDGYADALDYGMTGYDYNFLYCQDLAYGIKVRFDGDKVILCEIPSAPAGAVVIGEINGDKVSFPTQYLGVDPANLCHVYFQPLIQHLTFDEMYVYPENTCVDSFDLILDPVTHTLIADEDNAYSINCGKDVLLTIDARGMLHNAQLTPFDPALPATPGLGQVYMYSNANPDWGFACFSFPMMDTEGYYIDPEQTYYRVYLDDELQELDTTVYTGISDDQPTVTDIPFLLSNAANIFAFNWNYMHQIVTYTEWEKLGIQIVYKAGGEERVSDIFNSDQTITSGTSSVEALDGIENAKIIESVFYDMSGRKLSNPTDGIFIRTDRYSDGTLKTRKHTH